MRTWGEKREEADLHNHVDLVEMLDIVDLDKGVAIAGIASLTLSSLYVWGLFFSQGREWLQFLETALRGS